MKPTHAIHPQGTFLFKNGVPFAYPETVGCGFAHTRFLREDGAAYSLGKVGPVVPLQPSGINLPMSLSMVTAKGASTTPFAADPTVTKARLLRAGESVLQVTDFPNCQRNRVQVRLKAAEVYSAVEVCIPNVKGLSRNYNTNRNGQWDGRVSGRMPDGRTLHVLVCDAKEKFPCGYRFEGANLYLTMYANLEPKNVSREGVDDLMAMHTGPLSTSLPPEYVQFLKTDPLISQAAQEVTADDQGSQRVDCWLTTEFWCSIGEAVEPVPPLVLLDGFESPIWSKPKPGVGNAELNSVEERELADHASWLDTGPRGTFLYGDFPEQPSSYTRRRNVSHYFHARACWRALLRTGDGRWYRLCRAFGNFQKASWLDGNLSHAKGLLPWSGPTSYQGWGHWVDSEQLLYCWLVDGDYLALDEFQRWMKGFVPPTSNDRESTVPARMCRVAYWFTGDVKWKAIADAIETRIRAHVAAVKQTDDWKTFGRGLGTCLNYDPLWTDKPLGIDWSCEGVLNVPDLAASQSLESCESLIRFGILPFTGTRIGPGLLGEAYVLLQMERIYDYYRGKHLTAEHHIIYGMGSDGTRVTIEKSDDLPRVLRIAMASWKPGDIPPCVVEIIAPDGTVKKFFDGPEKFPTYPVSRKQQDHVSGWPCVSAQVPLVGPPGRYTVWVHGHYWVQLFGPLQKQYAEWQDCTGEFLNIGQDANGEWVTGSVMVGN